MMIRLNQMIVRIRPAALCAGVAALWPLAAAAWGPAQHITAPAYAAGGSWTARNGATGLAASRDTVWLVWTDGIKVLPNTGHQVLCKRYDGGAWAGDTVVGYRGNWRGHNWYPACAVDPAGTVHAVWESNEYEFGGGYDLSYTSVRGGIWSGQQRLVANAANTWYPAIAATADGAVHVCWQDDREGGFRLFHKSLAGAGWSAETAVPGGQVAASFPSIAAYGNTIAVAWQDFRSGTFQVHVKELGGAGWGGDSAVSHSGTGAFTPCLAVDQGGGYHVAWEDWRDGNAEVYYRRFDRTTGTWGSEQRLTADPWRSRAPVLVCRGDSLADLFWEDDRGGYFQVMHRRALRGSWYPETTLTAGWADNRCPAACADERGNLHLVWSSFGVEPPTARPDLFAMAEYVDPWTKAVPSAGPAATASLPLRVSPNPAAGSAVISFAGDGRDDVASIRIYAVTGQLVRAWERGPSAGEVRWDCRDDRGRAVAAGVYLVAVRLGGRRGTARVAVVR
ncbi:MAG: hypothetical protein MUF78_03805 [Candidatus Edwardsbacteria bacterium]|nr:hypothetical protein [Candidatus Edwardsbacteria bacterium]